VHLDFEVDAQEWSEWAIGTAIRPEVIAFIRFRPGVLSVFDRDAHRVSLSALLGIRLADTPRRSRT
jgi:hypothetical protein